MKKLILILVLLVSIISCKKEDNSLSIGQITGFDFRKCASPCCGGFYIKIDTTTYRALDLPENSQLNLSNESLPLTVELRWKKVENSCSDDQITIEFIRKLTRQ